MRLVLTAALLPAVILFGGCSRRPETVKANPEAPVTIRAVRVNPESIRRTVELVGTLEGNQEVTISSQVAARVVAVRADLGDRVQHGQALVELDAAGLKLAVERQRAALAQLVVQLSASVDRSSRPC
jgi:multidrug efflux pump subunit AcrA (membrane-fusion protein)